MADPALRGGAELRAGARGCGTGSLLDPGGLGVGGEGLPFGVLREALVGFVLFGLFGAVMGMGAPVGVVLSLMIR